MELRLTAKLALAMALLIAATCALADPQFVTKKVIYKSADTTFQGVLVHKKGLSKPKPAILMVPNWMGVTDEAVNKAKKIADDDYAVFVADLYGTDTRPSNEQEAAAAAGKLRDDRELMRARMALAMQTLHGLRAPIDKQRIAAIGFCFGGGAVLEYGRTGADVAAIVSFHGDLVSPTLDKQQAAQTKGKVLVLHGAADPYVPQADVEQFISVMNETDVDWQLVQFGNTVHSFTNPLADQPGSRYNVLSAQRAYEYMDELFDEVFDR